MVMIQLNGLSAEVAIAHTMLLCVGLPLCKHRLVACLQYNKKMHHNKVHMNLSIALGT